MPGHYNMPVIPNRYPLDKNDKLGLLIGTILSGGLAAANSNRNMGENPLLRGIAGGVAGFDAGANQIQDSYSKMLDDYLKGEGMDFRNRQMTQEQQQFQDTLGLNREKFGEEKRRFEESGKPYRESQMKWKDAMSKNYDFDNQMAFDKRIQEHLNAKKDERFNTRMNQLKIRKMKNEVVNSRPKVAGEAKPPKMPDVGNYGKLKAQLAGLRSPQNIDYMGMPAADRAQSIADIENTIRVMEQYQPDLIPPQQASAKTPQNAMTEEDIQFTAKKYGISREEVLKRLGVQ